MCYQACFSFPFELSFTNQILCSCLIIHQLLVQDLHNSCPYNRIFMICNSVICIFLIHNTRPVWLFFHVVLCSKWKSNLDTSKTIFVLTIWYLFISKLILISNHTYFYSFILCALAWFSKFQKSTDKQNNNNKLMTRAAELARRHKNYVYRFPYGHLISLQNWIHVLSKQYDCYATMW